MKKILGLDIGTNSIGWALIDKEDGQIVGMGSRIVPMGAEVSEFEKGNPQTKNATRRMARSIRRMGKRYKTRRNKLLYILYRLGMLHSQFQFSKPFSDPEKIQKVNLLPIRRKTSQLNSLDLIKLKVKALNEKINLEEFGRIIFNYNQLRGYSGGGNDDEIELAEDLNEEKGNLKFEKITQTVRILSEPIKLQLKKKGKDVFELEVESDGDIYKGETNLNTLKTGDEVELQIIIRRNKGGDVSSIFFSVPSKTNWRKSMEELEDEFNKYAEETGREYFLCEYFLQKLQEKPTYRLRNKVILRKRYQAEFDAIWNTQLKYNPDFKRLTEDKILLDSISNFIFPGNNPEHKQKEYRGIANEKGLKYLIRDQIIYFQRELRDQSDLIGFCRYEKDQKVLAKSHPIFQEFKIWEQINKLSINSKIHSGTKKNGEIKYEYHDVPVNHELKAWLFDELQKKKELSAKGVYSKLERDGVIMRNESFLNGIHRDAKLKGNETLIFLKNQLKDWFDKLRLNEPENLTRFWDLLYNGKGNEYDLESDRCKNIRSFILENYGEVSELDKLTIRFSKIKFARSYASLSLKAIVKILPLMRASNYFDPDLPLDIHDTVSRLINEIQIDPFLKSVQELLEKHQVEQLTRGGMQSTYAAIIVYGKHTAENFSGNEMLSPGMIKHLPVGQLRNPLAEQMINETLKMVKEIWSHYHIKPDEIRVELARELKNSAQERDKIYKAGEANRKTNERIKTRLNELNKETSLGNIERYRLWSMQAIETFPFSNSKEPTPSELEKMKLWEEQKCLSPYTGQPIPLSKLFDHGIYDIDHIIPKSRYFDDSQTNKVICERSVNIDKGNRTSWEYFETGSTTEKLFSKDNFIDHINKNFHGRKRKNLLATQIPQDAISRQLKDTQYISIKVREELSKIVGSESVKTTTGGITDYLRHHWGLTAKFKELTQERFEKTFAMIKDDEIKSNIKWSKRFDHRHHALDALIIACTEPAHIQRLNNLNKALQDWLKVNKEKVMSEFEGSDDELLEAFINLANNRRESILEEIKGFRNFEHPWPTFSVDAERELQKIVVSHKPKDKLLFQSDQKGGEPSRKRILRIRGELHEGTLYGLSDGKESYRIKLSKLAGKQFATEKTIEKIIDPVIKATIKAHLSNYHGNKTEAFSAEGINDLNKTRKIPINGFKIFYKDQSEKYNLTKLGANRFDDQQFNKILARILDEGIRQKLVSHLDVHGGDLRSAFSAEGMNEFNKENNPPLKTIKLKATENDDEEDIALSLLQLTRKSSYNNKLLVSTGSNYAFVVLEKDGKRHFDEISFFDAAKLANQAIKTGVRTVTSVIRQHFENQHPESKLLFILKQNYIVYLLQPNEELITNPAEPGYKNYWQNKKLRSENIYVVVKFSGKQIYFLKHNIAKPIANKIEFGSQNCYEIVNGISIKGACIKINVDRLGNLSPIENDKENALFR